jgi:hypothetical protein
MFNIEMVYRKKIVEGYTNTPGCLSLTKMQ